MVTHRLDCERLLLALASIHTVWLDGICYLIAAKSINRAGDTGTQNYDNFSVFYANDFKGLYGLMCGKVRVILHCCSSVAARHWVRPLRH